MSVSDHIKWLLKPEIPFQTKVKSFFAPVDTTQKIEKKKDPINQPAISSQRIEKQEAFYGGHYNNVFTISYDGEKNFGEMGPIREYQLHYDNLRLRSWQAYLESEVAQTVVGKLTKWVVGAGLKLQAEPNKLILASEGITIDYAKLTRTIEARWAVNTQSKSIDYTTKKSLNGLAKKAKINAVIGGDVLVVLRAKNGLMTVQLIDGAHVQSPAFGSDFNDYKLPNGHIIRHGIEMKISGEPVAYWVKDRQVQFRRIPAKNRSSGLTTAFLVYGMEYRLDNHRGMPLVSAVLETMKKLERYKEATVGSAEERAKIAFFIEHGMGSTGENPLIRQVAKASGFGDTLASGGFPQDAEGKKLADQVAATTNKMTFNMPQDSTLKQLESKNEIHFKDFYTVNIELVCAALQIPYEVAMSKYDSNFSASRAALKDWEHTIHIERDDFGSQFYRPIYAFWLHLEILKNKVQAPGYIEAARDNNLYVLESYRNARFIGPGVPHVDPVKEVKAERAKLGALADNIPLTTVEKAIEALNGGDVHQNYEKFKNEVEEFNDLDLMTEDPTHESKGSNRE